MNHLSSAFSTLKAALNLFLRIALEAWRSDNQKVITMNESPPNQSQLEICYRGAVRGHQRRHFRLYPEAWCRWGTTVENVPRTAEPPRDPKNGWGNGLFTRKFLWKNFMNVDVQRNHLVKRRERTHLFEEFRSGV